jgi:hypothetical protein
MAFPLKIWTPTDIKVKLTKINNTLTPLQKMVLVHQLMDSGIPPNPLLAPKPDHVYDLIQANGKESDICVIYDLLKLIPLLYVPSPKYHMSGAIKHNLESIKDYGYSDPNNGNVHYLVDPHASQQHVIREHAILALMIMDIPFKFDPVSTYFFLFKGKEKKRIQNGALDTYKRRHGLHDSSPWSYKVHFAIKPMGIVRIFIILLCAQRKMRRRRCQSLPAELWMNHILPHFKLGEVNKPHYGRYYCAEKHW